MKTWFDEHRAEMLNSVCEKVLSPQVQGPLSFAEIIQIAGLLEASNTEVTVKNGYGGKHKIDIVPEVAQAIVAETVQTFDEKTISNFAWGAREEHFIDFADDDSLDLPAAPTYIGDKLAKLPERMRKILNYFPDDAEPFVLCTPLMISILQSVNKTSYEAEEGAFKGPNNTMLVGRADGAPVYSYLPNHYLGAGIGDDDLIILGYYQKGEDAAVTQRLIIKNLSLG